MELGSEPESSTHTPSSAYCDVLCAYTVMWMPKSFLLLIPPWCHPEPESFAVILERSVVACQEKGPALLSTGTLHIAILTVYLVGPDKVAALGQGRVEWKAEIQSTELRRLSSF